MLFQTIEENVMTAIIGTPEEVLARVQAMVERQVPHAVCELQDYKENIAVRRATRKVPFAK
jgi:hypothetical protein